MIREYFRLATQERAEPVHVCNLSAAHASSIGATVTHVWLSLYSVGKQFVRHSDLLPHHYEMIPYIIENGEVIAANDNKALHFVLDARLEVEYRLKVTIKATADGRELFLTSFHKLRENDYRRLRKKAKNARR
jgi:hypothetical protein